MNLRIFCIFIRVIEKKAKTAVTRADVEKLGARSTVDSASKKIYAVDAVHIHTNDMKTMNFLHFDEAFCFDCDTG